MATLFYLDNKKKSLLHRECYELCPELRLITSEEVLFIVLAEDYKSPYNRFPREERIRRAKRHVWGTSDAKNENKQTVKNAMKLYRSLQYDVKRETMINYVKKIELINKEMLEDNSSMNIKKHVEAISLLQKEIDKLQDDIDMNELKLVQLEGGGKLSLLEQMQASKELYELKNNEANTEVVINYKYSEDNGINS